jgi:hypothetical protein
VINLDEMGPEADQELPRSGAGVRPQGQPAAKRARQAADYGRRGKGYLFGAFRQSTNEAKTEVYKGTVS